MDRIVEAAIQDARALAETIALDDSRRLVANGKLALAEQLVQQARAAVTEALAEINSAPEEFASDDGLRIVL